MVYMHNIEAGTLFCRYKHGMPRAETSVASAYLSCTWELNPGTLWKYCRAIPLVETRNMCMESHVCLGIHAQHWGNTFCRSKHRMPHFETKQSAAWDNLFEEKNAYCCGMPTWGIKPWTPLQSVWGSASGRSRHMGMQIHVCLGIHTRHWHFHIFGTITAGVHTYTLNTCGCGENCVPACAALCAQFPYDYKVVPATCKGC